jgi:hypothetical protein
MAEFDKQAMYRRIFAQPCHFALSLAGKKMNKRR